MFFILWELYFLPSDSLRPFAPILLALQIDDYFSRFRPGLPFTDSIQTHIVNTMALTHILYLDVVSLADLPCHLFCVRAIVGDVDFRELVFSRAVVANDLELRVHPE